MFDFHQSTNNDSILKITSWLLFPIICLYALYIQINGEVGSGGGFQAGVIISVAYILFLIVFGAQKASMLFSSDFLIRMSACGIILYLLTGISTMFLGGNFLEFSSFKFIEYPQAFGLFIIEFGIGISIFGCMSAILFTFYSLLNEDNQRKNNVK